ncbi:MAG TPA: hypothetical protein VHC90_05585 [Bryobacteraceae bacterium]|nr:hypothetical protein [Bryobacteraceae bacterium]
MSTKKRLTLENVDFGNRDEMNEFLRQVIAAGMERVRAETAELKARGLMDENGNLLITELPPDMREGSDCDFGG